MANGDLGLSSIVFRKLALLFHPVNSNKQLLCWFHRVCADGGHDTACSVVVFGDGSKTTRPDVVLD